MNKKKYEYEQIKHDEFEKYAKYNQGKGTEFFDEMQTNFVELNHANKILILDTIIQHAKDVFGPYGGIYGEAVPEQVGQDDYVPSWYRKSKDGHNFFSSLRMYHYYGNTVLMGIRQLTKYISGYEGETSRDGTTSLAMVGCQFAKNALMTMQQMEEVEQLPIPTTMINRIFDLVTEAGTEIIETKRVPVYDEETAQYINGGFDTILNAISTTVDGDMRFVHAFREIMEHCQEKKYNIMSGSMVTTPNKVNGTPGIELDIISGLKLRASHIVDDIAGGFRGHNSIVYVLNGFINPEHRELYVAHFNRWLERVCNATDANGQFIFAKNWNPQALDAPIILITRKQDYLFSTYADAVQKGVELRAAGGKTTVVKPIIMLAHNTEDSELYYRDVTSVFSESMINLDGFNRYAQTLNRKAGKEVGFDKHVSPTEYNLDSLFPVPNFKTMTFTGTEAFTEDHYDPLIGDSNTAVWQLRERVGSVANLICTAAYTGHGMFLTPISEELIVRTKEKREEFLRLLKNYSDVAASDNKLMERLDHFNGIQITGTIKYRSNDEYIQLVTLYEDAVGVFQSTHAWGVLAGGNITIPKYMDTIEEKVLHEIRQFPSYGYDESITDLYYRFASGLLNGLRLAYYEAYTHLDKSASAADHYNDLICGNPGENDDNIEYRLRFFNSVANKPSLKILEAARTTADVFAGACSIAKDMISLKRIYVNSTSDYREAQLTNRNRTLHPLYKEYLTK